MLEGDFLMQKDRMFVASRVPDLWPLVQQAQAYAEMYSVVHCYEQESWVDYCTVTLTLERAYQIWASE